MERTLLTDLHEGSDRATREKTISDLCDRFEIDINHAQRVAANAISILDELQLSESVPVQLASLLEAAALLHDIGSNVQVDRHHIYARDLILKHKLEGFDENQRSILAFLVSLHRKSVKHKKLQKQIKKTNLPAAFEQPALQLAAILRIADGLDQSHTQTTRIETIKEEDHRYVLEISGPQAKRDGGRALQKSDLWTYTFHRPLHCILTERQILLPGPQWSGLALPAQSLTRIEIKPDDKILDAVQRILTYHFIRMLQHEPGVRLGNDIDAVHDMRVAIRRMRTAARIFKPFFPEDLLSPLREGLKRTGRGLGEVRDLEVFKFKLDLYIQEQSSWRPVAYEPLLDHWQSQYDQARSEMLDYIESRPYRKLVSDFANFVSSFRKMIKDFPPQARDLCVSQVIPSIIYERDKQIRLYDHQLEAAPLELLHTLRIKMKRFRYTLEYFESALGEDIQSVIAAAIIIQDHLGDLHDATYALDLVRSQINNKQPDEIHNRALTQYAQHLKAYIKEARETFPDAWDHFRRYELRQTLASAVALL